jgi:hypothetical protein
MLAGSYRHFGRLAVVAAGIVFGQVVLYGPTLVGKKVLLPLGCLADANKYIPQGPGTPKIKSPQPFLIDLITLTEPDRRFAADELAEGRLPHWTPYIYGGVPFIWPSYSPFFLLSAASPSPTLLAWAQLLAALVAGLGAFAFARQVLRLSFWPSAVAGWCYPITGWFVLFQGFASCIPVIWLPWMLFAIDRTVRGSGAGGPGLAVVTGLTLVSGNLDTAGQVLLISVLFALWSAWHFHRGHRFRLPIGWTGPGLAAALGVGFLLATPYLLPLQQYAQEGQRASRRWHGTEERPPLGVVGLPQLVLPDMYGTYGEIGTCPLLEAGEKNQIESPAIAYAGLLAMVLLAPWAFWDRRRRSSNGLLLGLAVLGAGWSLNLPGVVHLLRLPGLNLMSHNRLLFVSSFALLALAAVGLENLLSAKVEQRPWLWLQAALLAVLLGWSCYRMAVFPEPLATELEAKIRAGKPDLWAIDMGVLRQAQSWFATRYGRAAILSAFGLLAWLLLHYRLVAGRRLVPPLAALMVGDLLLFGYHKRIPQDPSLYYPDIPVLSSLKLAAPGRVLGINCLPASLAQAVGLADVRGFDSVDPSRWVRLLSLASATRRPDAPYAAVQWLPTLWRALPPDGVQLPPILDMLGVRYAIFRGTPGANLWPRLQSDDYWVLENRSVLPRVSVPRHVAVVRDEEDILKRMSRPLFDPRSEAYVTTDLSLPNAIRGEAKLGEETPTRMVIDAHMLTTGLLLIADRWDVGWQAYVDGQPANIVRVNYALRGVVVLAGHSRVELRYEPRMLTLGNRLALGGLTLLAAWSIAPAWRRRKKRQRLRLGPHSPGAIPIP